MVEVSRDTARLCIFARAPRMGRVKSRLAESLGAAAALSAYETLVTNTLAQVCGHERFEIEFWVAADPPHESPTGSVAIGSTTQTDPAIDATARELISDWVEQFDLAVRLQTGVDLGTRMAAALRQCLADGRDGIVIGTDCPAVDAVYVAQGFAALQCSDLVVGPAEDGGYGLIGVGRRGAGSLDAVFEGIDWGTDEVLAQTLDRAERCGLSVCLLETIWDVDSAADWARFLERR
ncbi:MAG: DUF2064 domain-containing protein [Pseudomonadales bacterium]